MLVHVGSQDQDLGTPSRYLARTISWIPCKVLLLYYVLLSAVLYTADADKDSAIVGDAFTLLLFLLLLSSLTHCW